TQVFMIHRALLGSLERFFGVLIEHYAGAFPLWLAPVQAAVLPISDKFLSYGDEVLAELKKAGVRASVSSSADKIGAKIREATMQKIPYMAVVGGREAETKTVSVRTRDGKDLGALPLADFIVRLKKEIEQKA
ncbi:MAG TPA: His/Gly/Thr/Pro-type tRNA ligase C-terminal domain-containing protein, partial [Elusimicrobiota bacterium]|nr:His/Gly/Thr/Pro-type tRNA ligase C-terminal domain-containing protein [Elusimicrobiota bacterium]